MISAFQTLVQSICDERTPDVIYVAIGCARSSLQQCPPFLGSGSNTLCIWIDPSLEPAPEGLLRVMAPVPVPVPMADCEVIEGSKFICVALRQYFYWVSNSNSVMEDPAAAAAAIAWDSFMNMLYRQVVLRATCVPKLIVQDFSGHEMRSHYPLERFQRERFLEHVLFDVTYGNCGCIVDFDTVNILKRADGSFFQPFYETLTKIAKYCEFAILNAEINRRMIIIQHSVYRLYRTMEGREQPRDYYSPDCVLKCCSPLLSVYDIPIAMDHTTLRKLLLAFYHDISTVADVEHLEPDVIFLLDFPDNKEFLDGLGLLRQLVTHSEIEDSV